VRRSPDGGVQTALIMWIAKIPHRFAGAIVGRRVWRFAVEAAGFRGWGMAIRNFRLWAMSTAAVVVPLTAALVWAPLSWAQAQSPVQAPASTEAQAPAPAQMQVPAQIPAAAQPPVSQPAQAGSPQADANCPGHPDALGTSRILPLDPTQYPRVGHMQYPASLPLNDKEVIITFDDGPLPPYSNEILDILASQCVKVTYFMVGEMARAYPAVVRRVYEEGHTIGTHSEDHPTRFGQLPVEKMRHEIDWGISDVSAALGDPKYLAPFFRIPGLARSDAVESELAARGLIVFSSDTVADDWHRHIKPNQIITLAMRRLEALGKGILLLHDIHPATAAALPGLLQQLKESGFHIVQVVPAPSYEIAMAKKPEAPIPASELRGDETIIGNGMDHKTPASWPQTSANNAADDSALPVPDPSAFEPDALPSQDTADVQWPAQPELATPAKRHVSVQRSRRQVARGTVRDTTRHAKEQRQTEHARAHRRAHAHADARGNHADAEPRLETVTAMFTPALPLTR
jgi:peptidoglycan/xylan/chitin deacetylase (PgdA/CDA1 family)